MGLHSRSDFLLQPLDISGCKEVFIVVAIVHRDVKLERLKSCCIFLYRSCLFEGEQLIYGIPVVICTKFLLYDMTECLPIRSGMILFIGLPPFGGIALQMHYCSRDFQPLKDGIDGEIVGAVVKPYFWIGAIKFWKVNLGQTVMRERFLSLLGLSRRAGLEVMFL